MNGKPQLFMPKAFGEKLLKRQGFGTRVEGVDVVVTLGAKEVRMDYTTALKLSVFLRHSGRAAKRRARDGNSIVIPCADLTDANLDELEAQKLRDGTAVFARVK